MNRVCYRCAAGLAALASLACGRVKADDNPPFACDASVTVQALREAQGVARLSVFTLPAAHKNYCTSIGKVLSRMMAGRKAGGRKLEDDKPLELAAAERERQTALADPELRADLAALIGQEADPARRAVLEAAVFHDFGHYQARDLALRHAAAGRQP